MTAIASRMLAPTSGLLVGLTALFAPIAALAHHAHDYAPPDNAWQGLLSGLAHPFLSAPHLVALIVLGMIAAASSVGRLTLAAFCAGSMLTAIALEAGAAGWPLHDLWIAVSLLAGGGWLWWRRAQALPVNLAAIAIVAAAGSIHGQIAAESIEAASTAILSAYWAGILIAQAALGGAVLTGLRVLSSARQPIANRLRLAGAAVSAGTAVVVLLGAA